MSIDVAFIGYEALAHTAEDFLARHHVSRYLPVPIEQIIDVDFGIDIVPMPGFHINYEMDAFISTDLTEIRVDKAVYESKNKNRYRFSLAHELAHRLLHASIFAQLKFKTVQEWKKSRDDFTPAAYSRLEFQANTVAGLILVPPQELAEKFRDAEQAAEKCKIDLQSAGAETWELIANLLASEFGVSKGVIDRRAIKDGLWEGNKM